MSQIFVLFFHLILQRRNPLYHVKDQTNCTDTLRPLPNHSRPLRQRDLHNIILSATDKVEIRSTIVALLCSYQINVLHVAIGPV